MSYNGWSNKETWLVNVWLGEDVTKLAFDTVEEIHNQDG
jgi:hypothetical protein